MSDNQLFENLKSKLLWNKPVFTVLTVVLTVFAMYKVSSVLSSLNDIYEFREIIAIIAVISGCIVWYKEWYKKRYNKYGVYKFPWFTCTIIAVLVFLVITHSAWWLILLIPIIAVRVWIIEFYVDTPWICIGFSVAAAICYIIIYELLQSGLPFVPAVCLLIWLIFAIIKGRILRNPVSTTKKFYLWFAPLCMVSALLSLSLWLVAVIALGGWLIVCGVYTLIHTINRKLRHTSTYWSVHRPASDEAIQPLVDKFLEDGGLK